MNRFKSRSRALRADQTAAEELLWRELRNRQLRGSSASIDRYIVDFVTLDGKVIVEVDGGTHSTPQELESDDNRTRCLEGLGFHVLRVTNTDVYKNLEGVLETLLHELDRS